MKKRLLKSTFIVATVFTTCYASVSIQEQYQNMFLIETNPLLVENLSALSDGFHLGQVSNGVDYQKAEEYVNRNNSCLFYNAKQIHEDKRIACDDTLCKTMHFGTEVSCDGNLGEVCSLASEITCIINDLHEVEDVPTTGCEELPSGNVLHWVNVIVGSRN